MGEYKENGNETIAVPPAQAPKLEPAPAPAPQTPPIKEEHMEKEASKALISKDTGLVEKSPGGSADRDAALARVATEKRLALIKAWEDSEKSKADNKAYKKLATVESWENSKKASVEARLKKFEEKLEKKKAQYAELMRNKIAEFHKEAEEKRAVIEAKKGEDYVKIDETAAKHRASGSYAPKKFFGWCSA